MEKDGSVKYIGVKVVSAKPITLEQFIETTGRNPYSNNPNPAKDLTNGYAVTYEDGYVGYSPKEVFEKAYAPINGLNVTCLGVISPDYKERFKAEYFALLERTLRLRKMVTDWDEGVLKFTPTCPRGLYTSQLDFMEGYLHILQARAKMEGVELHSDAE